MKDVGEMEQMEVWFVTGSQHLYGPEALAKVAMNSSTIATSLDSESALPVRVVWKPVLTTADEILNLCRDASRDSACVGLVLWMHTFSPAKMWIAGLTALTKPFLHLHTQFDRELPYSMIDMDFMNLNQAAHGDREFGFITARLPWLARLWSASGRTRKLSPRLARGLVQPSDGMNRRISRSHASAITCVTSR